MFRNLPFREHSRVEGTLSRALRAKWPVGVPPLTGAPPGRADSRPSTG